MRWTRIGGMTALVAALAIGLALSLGLWGSWTASAQDTFVVNDDTTPADGGCGTPDFQTDDIEEAIDDTDVADGDTLVICEGTYAGGVTIDKEVVVEGRAAANRDDIVIQVPDAGADGLTISSTGVTIRHLKLEGPVDTDNGIDVNAGAATIEDVEVTDWATGINVDANDVTIQDSYIYDNWPDGIFLDHANNVRVARNTIDSIGRSGLLIDTADRTMVEENTLLASSPAGDDSVGLYIKGRSYVEVLRNIFTTRVRDSSWSNGGIFLDLPAEALVIIGGSDANANTFDGDLASDMYYIYLACTSEATVNATHNYWKGSPVIPRGVSGVIFNDENDDPDNPGADCPGNDDGAVVFHPTSSGPAPTPTPSPTPSPTATPTPTATATPTATPGATRSIDLSPAGWHSLVWSGADATDPGTALACIAGKYSIAYAWEGPTAGFKRYVEGCAVPGICNMSPLNKYAAMLVSISAAATCQMPVAP